MKNKLNTPTTKWSTNCEIKPTKRLKIEFYKDGKGYTIRDRNSHFKGVVELDKRELRILAVELYKIFVKEL